MAMIRGSRQVFQASSLDLWHVIDYLQRDFRDKYMAALRETDSSDLALPGSFWHNLGRIHDAFMAGMLFVCTDVDASDPFTGTRTQSLVGFLAGSIPMSDGYANIDFIETATAHRRSGIGRALVETFEALIRERKRALEEEEMRRFGKLERPLFETIHLSPLDDSVPFWKAIGYQDAPQPHDRYLFKPITLSEPVHAKSRSKKKRTKQ